MRMAEWLRQMMNIMFNDYYYYYWCYVTRVKHLRKSESITLTRIDDITIFVHYTTSDFDSPKLLNMKRKLQKNIFLVCLNAFFLFS